jgi:glycosyltransferase involved in cell wall biosynthesis
MMTMEKKSLNTSFVNALAQIREERERAVIINCNTKLVTTLALSSAIRYADMPILLIDCESSDGSADWFAGLAAKHGFDFVSAPLRPHGKTLDLIFTKLRDERILLIDSDLEILGESLMPALRAGIEHEDVYGSGFLHASELMKVASHTKVNPSRYMERMWIPLTFLKSGPVRAAIENGVTFMHSRDYLEFPWSRAFSKILYARHRIPGLDQFSINVFASSCERRFGERVAFREYDTGARLHEALTKQGLSLFNLGEPHWSNSVRHYHGVTRATLKANQANATAPNIIQHEVATRLKAEYGLTVE